MSRPSPCLRGARCHRGRWEGQQTGVARIGSPGWREHGAALIHQGRAREASLSPLRAGGQLGSQVEGKRNTIPGRVKSWCKNRKKPERELGTFRNWMAPEEDQGGNDTRWNRTGKWGPRPHPPSPSTHLGIHAYCGTSASSRQPLRGWSVAGWKKL